MKLGTFFTLITLSITNIYTQVIPSSLTTDWRKAGYEGYIPKPTKIINVKKFSAFGDSLQSKEPMEMFLVITILLS